MSAYYQAKKALIEYVKKYEEKRRKLSKKSSVHSYFEKRMKQENKLVSDTLEIFGYTPAQIQEEKRAIIKQIAEAKSRLPTNDATASIQAAQEEQKKLNVIADMVARNPALSSALSSVGPIDDLLQRESFNLPGVMQTSERLGLTPKREDLDNLSISYDYVIRKANRSVPRDAPKPAGFVGSDEINADLSAIEELRRREEEAGDELEEEYAPSSASELARGRDPASLFLAKPGSVTATSALMRQTIRNYFDGATGMGAFGERYSDYGLTARSDIKKVPVEQISAIYKQIYERTLAGA
jgi:hypothetical protein